MPLGYCFAIMGGILLLALALQLLVLHPTHDDADDAERALAIQEEI